MRCRSRLFVLACLGALVACSCGVAADMVGGKSRTDCGKTGATNTLILARLESPYVSLVSGCTRMMDGGMRAGQTRFAVARVAAEDLDLLLSEAGVEATSVSSLDDDAIEGPQSFDVEIAPLEGPWAPGDRLSYRDEISADGFVWNRYMAWGDEVDGPDYLVMVQLETPGQ